MTTVNGHRVWIKADDVAEMLGVSVHTVRSWPRRGLGPPVYKLYGSIRYDRDEVEAWRQSRRLPGDARR